MNCIQIYLNAVVIKLLKFLYEQPKKYSTSLFRGYNTLTHISPTTKKSIRTQTNRKIIKLEI